MSIASAGGRHRLLRFNTTARVALLVQASTTAALGWWTPGSLTARVLADGGAVGSALLVAMTVLVSGGWIDVLVNDLLPDRMTLDVVRRKEHIGYLMLGAVFWAQAMGGLTTQEPGAGVLLGYYLMIGGVCCWYGWMSALRGGRHG